MVPWTVVVFTCAVARGGSTATATAVNPIATRQIRAKPQFRLIESIRFLESLFRTIESLFRIFLISETGKPPVGVSHDVHPCGPNEKGTPLGVPFSFLTL
jgi:hypothetical protein